MNTKTLLAALVGGIAAFLLGWVVYGMMLMSYFQEHTMQYEGLMKDMTKPEVSSMVAIFVGNLAWSLAIALICSWSNMVGFIKGAVIGASIGFLMGFQVDMFYIAFMNWYKDTTVIVVDMLVGAVFSAIVGGIIGWMMGMGKKGIASAA